MRLFIVGHLVTLARLEREAPPVLEFGHELASEHQQDVAAAAPVIGKVAGRSSTIRTRTFPAWMVRQCAVPVSPGCSVGGTRSQSVTPNGTPWIIVSPPLSKRSRQSFENAPPAVLDAPGQVGHLRS